MRGSLPHVALPHVTFASLTARGRRGLLWFLLVASIATLMPADARAEPIGDSLLLSQFRLPDDPTLVPLLHDAVRSSLEVADKPADAAAVSAEVFRLTSSGPERTKFSPFLVAEGWEAILEPEPTPAQAAFTAHFSEYYGVQQQHNTARILQEWRSFVAFDLGPEPSYEHTTVSTLWDTGPSKNDFKPPENLMRYGAAGLDAINTAFGAYSSGADWDCSDAFRPGGSCTYTWPEKLSDVAAAHDAAGEPLDMGHAALVAERLAGVGAGAGAGAGVGAVLSAATVAPIILRLAFNKAAAQAYAGALKVAAATGEKASMIAVKEALKKSASKVLSKVAPALFGEVSKATGVATAGALSTSIGAVMAASTVLMAGGMKIADFIETQQYDGKLEDQIRNQSFDNDFKLITATKTEEYAGLYYVACDPGYDGYFTRCMQECPPGSVTELETCRVDAHTIGKHTYDTGTGSLPDVCGGGKVFENGACYPPCPDGWDAWITRCFQRCPTGNGWSQLLETCNKPGTIWWNSYTLLDYHGCAQWTGSCTQRGALYYVDCAPGTHSTGLHTCEYDCPSGFADGVTFCHRPRFDRGVGTAKDGCSGGLQEHLGFCYPPCDPGYARSVTRCIQQGCPEGYVELHLTCQRHPSVTTRGWYDRGTGDVAPTDPAESSGAQAGVMSILVKMLVADPADYPNGVGHPEGRLVIDPVDVLANHGPLGDPPSGGVVQLGCGQGTVDVAACTVQSCGDFVSTVACDDSVPPTRTVCVSACDTIPPHVEGAPERAPDVGEYHTAPVSIVWSARDRGVELDPPPAPTLVDEDGHWLVGSPLVCDEHLNCAAGQVFVSLDTAAPVVEIAGFVDGANVPAGAEPVATCAANDAVSGLAGPCVLSAVREPVGANAERVTVTATATDNAGLTGTATRSYTVGTLDGGTDPGGGTSGGDAPGDGATGSTGGDQGGSTTSGGSTSGSTGAGTTTGGTSGGTTGTGVSTGGASGGSTTGSSAGGATGGGDATGGASAGGTTGAGTTAGGAQPSDGDTDDDGLSDEEEAALGSDPDDPASPSARDYIRAAANTLPEADGDGDDDDDDDDDDDGDDDDGDGDGGDLRERLEEALDPELWRDGDRLALKEGKRSLGDLEHVAGKLRKIAEDDDGPPNAAEDARRALTYLLAATDRLVDVLEGELADLELEGKADEKRDDALEHAAKDRGKAREKLQDGRVDKAISYLAKAWKHLDKGWRDAEKYRGKT